ncbi:MAG: hypothetical protein CMF52_03290 [Legionellales bacterium]|nr:hypothetical protein [Legionellales bacterium]
MSVKNFKFVSPGVFINEIDNSFRPRQPDAIGPVIIGRASKGLAGLPTKVESFSQFVEQFGDTVPGAGGGDIYREGNRQSPMYGTYAAKAFLRSNVAPITYIRLMGVHTPTGQAAGGDAAAGWKTDKTPVTMSSTPRSQNGGAYGLFLFTSSSAVEGDLGTGTCAAIWYLQNGVIQLSGALWGSGSVTASAGAFISSDANGNYRASIQGTSQGTETFTFNFNNNSENFIRSQFCTNPQLWGGNTTTFYPSGSKDYWLGETFEQSVQSNGFHNSASVGCIVALGSGSLASGVGPSQMKGQQWREATAGWFISQDVGVATSYEPVNMQKLFRLKGRGHGEWLHKNVKVSIERIKQSSTNTSQFGSFSVVLRSLLDTDNRIEVLERFDNCNLNPASPNFVARKIGDVYAQWDNSAKRLRYYGEYPNMSKFIRVEMNNDVEAGATDPSLLPFGYYSGPRYAAYNNASDRADSSGSAMVTYQEDLYGFSGKFQLIGGMEGGIRRGDGAPDVTASFTFPSSLLRSSSMDGGLVDQTDAYFGFRTTRTAKSTAPASGLGDLHRLLYADFPDDPNHINVGDGVQPWAYIFSLDNVRKESSVFNYESGSRKGGVSVTAASATASYKTLLDEGIDKFTAPFWGGFDGFDITKPDPLANVLMGDGSTEDNSYVYHSYKRAIDTVADPELIDMNLLVVPGLTNTALTNHMVRTCEDRADTMALIDLPNVYTPTHEGYKKKAQRVNLNVVGTANTLKDRRLDSSYGATFYPWVQTRDESTGQLVWIPPSVAMMGVLASSEARSDVWFAPAGFNRGGLTEGAAGIPIVNVSERLSSKERDTLYDGRINPIASFPSNGIVVLGQKTLQERPSALDRINVRRLVIYLKKQISILSTQVLFEQNVQATWDRFTGLIEPFLANVKTRFGITDYRLILDETTTTPDLIDQNILYAKIMVKPARAIEFIAIDFVIASTGASFDD